jgi:hypothetical protein
MNIIDRAKHFVQSLRGLADRSAWDWRRCPRCGDSLTHKHGHYIVRPWFLDGRREIAVQRHYCHACQKTYSERSPLLVRGSWYAREVHRFGIDHWQHVGSSLRRSAELVRSLLGRQERWLLWHPLGEEPWPDRRCRFAPSTLHRWLDRAGMAARATVQDQLRGVRFSGQVGVDGLFAVLRGKSARVVLLLRDCVSGLVYPPVVVKDEDEAGHWSRLFIRGRVAGLDRDELRGLVSDGSRGLLGQVRRHFEWLNHQRCVFHLWRLLRGELARQVSEAAEGLAEEQASTVRAEVRRELRALVRSVLNAKSAVAADLALGRLRAHRRGGGLSQLLAKHQEAIRVHLKGYNQGLERVVPEWVWRDFRLRLSRGRNHGSADRLERASLLFAIYHNFTPAQRRSERKRTYRRAGKSCLELAGAPPGKLCYLDALSV